MSDPRDRRGLLTGLAVIALGLLAVVGGTFIATGDNGNAIESWPPLLRAVGLWQKGQILPAITGALRWRCARPLGGTRAGPSLAVLSVRLG